MFDFLTKYEVFVLMKTKEVKYQSPYQEAGS